MEEGVLSQIRKGPINAIFDSNQYISSVSGSGNNWAVGYSQYGPEYRDELLNGIRIQAEQCDSLQAFFTIHSLGGGTGSGLGSYINELVCDEYPETLRFSTCVFPSQDDDVVISPYNRY
jgi:tubulin epsilon